MKSPQLNSAINYLRQQLNTNNDMPLPSVRKIASECGVALKTAHKAVVFLMMEGVICSRWGHGIYPTSAKSPSKKVNTYGIANNRRLKTDRIIEAIESDIINNVFKQGDKLPSLKILMSRYNTSYPTLHKVLQTLLKKNLVQNVGYSYYITRSKPQWKFKIGVICAVNDTGDLIIEKERERNFFRMLYMDADKYNLQLEMIGYRDWGRSPVFSYNSEETSKLIDDTDTIGYILVSWHIKDYMRCLNSLSLMKKPVSVWLEHSDGIPDQKELSRSGTVAFFDQSYSQQSGYDMGCFLLKLGHRKIAYISPFHGSAWSQQRLSGLRKAFDEAGIKNGIVDFTDKDFDNDWTFMDIVLAEKMLQKYLDSTRLKEDCKNFSPEKIDQILFNLNTIFRDNLIYNQSIKFLKEATLDSSVTVWVAANDLCAFLCLEYLKKNNYRVPHDISLVGFDNTFQSLKQGLTSYDFNTQGLVHGMIDYLLNPSGELYNNTSRVLHLSGKVIQRGSVKSIK
ncbi:MAG: substrate-binding domain-containing protein [Fibrobacter sp.]|nr:substrate-binding domain-containing protein [Fibrobacter sp.]